MDKNIIDQIMDPDNTDPIEVWTEGGVLMQLAQIAVIPVEGELYLLAQPINVPEIADDEALVYRVAEEHEEAALELVVGDRIVDIVFGEYYAMLREAGIDVPDDV